MLLVELNRDFDSAVNELDDAVEVLLLQPACGECGRADAQTARDERSRVSGDGVLVDGDTTMLQHLFHASSVYPLRQRCY